MAIYLDITGGEAVKGPVTTEGFKDQIQVGSFQFGAGRGIGSPKADALNREASAPSLSEITLTKSWDPVSSAKLLQLAINGTGKADAKLSFTTTGAKGEEAYLTIELTNVMVSGFSVTSGGDKPSESFSLNYVKITVTPWKIAAAGGDPKKGDVVSHDLSTRKTNA